MEQHGEECKHRLVPFEAGQADRLWRCEVCGQGFMRSTGLRGAEWERVCAAEKTAWGAGVVHADTLRLGVEDAVVVLRAATLDGSRPAFFTMYYGGDPEAGNEAVLPGTPLHTATTLCVLMGSQYPPMRLVRQLAVGLVRECVDWTRESKWKEMLREHGALHGLEEGEA